MNNERDLGAVAAENEQTRQNETILTRQSIPPRQTRPPQPTTTNPQPAQKPKQQPVVSRLSTPTQSTVTQAQVVETDTPTTERGSKSDVVDTSGFPLLAGIVLGVLAVAGILAGGGNHDPKYVPPPCPILTPQTQIVDFGEWQGACDRTTVCSKFSLQSNFDVTPTTMECKLTDPLPEIIENLTCRLDKSDSAKIGSSTPMNWSLCLTIKGCADGARSEYLSSATQFKIFQNIGYCEHDSALVGVKYNIAPSGWVQCHRPALVCTSAIVSLALIVLFIWYVRRQSTKVQTARAKSEDGDIASSNPTMSLKRVFPGISERFLVFIMLISIILAIVTTITFATISDKTDFLPPPIQATPGLSDDSAKKKTQ